MAKLKLPPEIKTKEDAFRAGIILVIENINLKAEKKRFEIVDAKMRQTYPEIYKAIIRAMRELPGAPEKLIVDASE